MSRARRARSSGSWPASRRPTYLCTVLWSVPASSAADLALRVRSNASSISMISSFFLVKTLPPTWTTTFQSTYGSAVRRSETGVLLSALGEISCPPVGSFLSAYGENGVSAVIVPVLLRPVLETSCDPSVQLPFGDQIVQRRPRGPK